jgi:hypothetical protein
LELWKCFGNSGLQRFAIRYEDKNASSIRDDRNIPSPHASIFSCLTAAFDLAGLRNLAAVSAASVRITRKLRRER